MLSIFDFCLSHKWISIFFFPFIVILFTTSSTTAQNGHGSTPDTVEQLSNQIRKIVKDQELPGAAVAIIQPDGEIWSQSFGVADRATNRAVTDSTLFRIASISKMFVGVAALQQKERGNLDLNDTLGELAPDLQFENPWSEHHPVRLVHLLEHTSGFDGYHPSIIDALDPGMTLQERMTYHPDWRNVRWPPGRFYAYSSPGTSAAAYAIQLAADKEFESYVENNILDPLGMDRTTYDRQESMRLGLASGYRVANSDRSVDYRHVFPRPSGALNASVTDLARFIKMLVNDGQLDGKTILQPESVRRMQTPKTTLAAKEYGIPAGYALGSVANEKDGFIWHGHTGGTTGYRSFANYLDEHKRGYVALFNVRNGDFGEITNLIEEYLTYNISPPKADPIKLDSDELSQYEGFYVNVSPQFELLRFFQNLTSVWHVTATDSVLQVSQPIAGYHTTWTPAEKGRFYAKGDPIGIQAFVSVDDERYLQMEGGEDGTFKQASSVLVWARWGLFSICIMLIVSTLLYGLIWLPKMFLDRYDSKTSLQIRLWPLLSALGFLFFVIGWIGVNSADNNDLITQINFYTVAIMMGSIMFGLFSGIGLIQAIRYRTSFNNSPSWWYSSLVSLIYLAMTCWLGYYGLVGLRIWAY